MSERKKGSCFAYYEVLYDDKSKCYRLFHITASNGQPPNIYCIERFPTGEEAIKEGEAQLDRLRKIMIDKQNTVRH